MIDQGGEPDYQFFGRFRTRGRNDGAYFGTHCDNVDFELQTVRSGKFYVEKNWKPMVKMLKS